MYIAPWYYVVIHYWTIIGTLIGRFLIVESGGIGDLSFDVT